MKASEIQSKLDLFEVVSQKVSKLKDRVEIAKLKKDIVKVKEDLLTIAVILDACDGVKFTTTHKDEVKRLIDEAGKLKTGIKHGLVYLTLMIQDYIANYRLLLVLETLPDGVYHTIREGKFDIYDEVVKVVDGKVIWCDNYFYEEYGVATQEELDRVIKIAEDINKEIEDDFYSSTTDED